MMEDGASLAARLMELEADVAYQQLATQAEPEFEYRPGRVPVLISAPHGAMHTRQGRAKEEDDFTAALALLASELTGAHVLYARRKSLTDPNWYRHVPYKRHLAEVVRDAGITFVLDVHGAASRRPFGLALGTLKGRSCPAHRPAIVGALWEAGFRPGERGLAGLDVDGLFTARGLDGQETVTRYAWETLGVPAAQLEINECLRMAGERADAYRPPACLALPVALARIAGALTGLVQLLADGRSALLS